jgi:hypothetical protein
MTFKKKQNKKAFLKYKSSKLTAPNPFLQLQALVQTPTIQLNPQKTQTKTNK